MKIRHAGPAMPIAIAIAMVVGLGVTGPAYAGADEGSQQPTADLTEVSPTPQESTLTGAHVPLMNKALVVRTNATDPAAVDVVVQALRDAGVSQVRQSAEADHGNRGTFVVYVGGPDENPASAEALAHLAPDAQGPQGLPSGGYVLAVGRDGGDKGAVLSGADPAGTFYAAQTFRQLLAGEPHQLRGIVIRDWPALAVRGGQESFYGAKWTYAEELEQIDFLAAHKQNAFLYHPRTADPHNAEKLWREPYTGERLQQLRTIVESANRQHVDFIYRLGPEAPTAAPGTGICHTDPGDLQAIIDRFEQLWSIGVRYLSLGWDDSHGGFVCDADEEAFGDDLSPKAAAQAYVTDYVYENFTRAHDGSRLIVIPTNYHAVEPTSYTKRLSALMPQDVTVYWTGRSVISPTITTDEAQAAKTIWDGRTLWIFDNYPVNDYARDRLHLGPVVNRDPGLASVVEGFTTNEMNQMAPSLIALSTSADFTWNPNSYDPEASWDRALRDIAGNDDAYRALRILAENSRFSRLDSTESTGALPLIEALWDSVDSGTDASEAASDLSAYFAAMEAAPATLRATMQNQGFVDDAEPWLDDLELYGQAGQLAVALVLARERGDEDAVQRLQTVLDEDRDTLHDSPQSLGTGVLEPFLMRASGVTNLALGRPVTSSSIKSDVRLPEYAVDGDLSTRWASQYNEPEWLQVDLGESLPIEKINLYWERAYGNAYRIQVSDDGVSWTTIYSTTTSNGGTDELTDLGGHGRYVRIALDERATQWGFSLWEVEIYSR